MGNHSGGFFCKYVKKHRKRARESNPDAGHVIIADKMSSDFSCNQGKQHATLSLS